MHSEHTEVCHGESRERDRTGPRADDVAGGRSSAADSRRLGAGPGPGSGHAPHRPNDPGPLGDRLDVLPRHVDQLPGPGERLDRHAEDRRGVPHLAHARRSGSGGVLLDVRVVPAPGRPPHRPVRRADHVHVRGGVVVGVHRTDRCRHQHRLAVRLPPRPGGRGERRLPSERQGREHVVPRRERALATSIYDSGARFGSAAALPLVAFLVTALGWRWSFVITGAIGILWAIGWALWYRDPRKDRGPSAEELDYIEKGGSRGADADEAAGAMRWRDLFRYRTVWGMMLGFFCLNFVIYFFITWFPTYLHDSRGFTLLKTGFYGVIRRSSPS